MNLLLIGDRKPLNDSDLAFQAFEDAGHHLTFLYRGAPYPLPFGMPIDDRNPVEQVRALVRERKIEAIFFRVDWFDRLHVEHGRALLSADFGVPKIFGYHCHTCHRTELEELAITRSDALVLLNTEAQAWFESLYGVRKPTLLVPSLLLPRKAWYDVPLKPKLSATDGRRHVVIPSNVIRVANVPPALDPAVPVENYVIDRYDYLTLIEQLAVRGVAVHIYGKFAVQGGIDASDVEAKYRALARKHDGLVHFAGRVDQAAFASELSQYDGALLTGFVPYQPVPKFDHMNYQIRLNPVLAARLPSFVPAGTSSCGERELAQSGAGLVFTSFEQLVDTLHDPHAMHRAAQSAHAVQDRHSIEPWIGPMTRFFASAAQVYRNRSSSRAA